MSKSIDELVEDMKQTTNMNTKRILVEKALSKLESEEDTKQRRLDIIISDKKRLLSDLKSTNISIGHCVYKLHKLSEELDNFLSEQDLLNRVLKRMEEAELNLLDVETYCNIRAEYEKPRLKIDTSKGLPINKEMLEGYLQNLLPLDLFLSVCDYLNGNGECIDE